MASGREYELWDTYNQRKLGDYKTQSSTLQAFYDCLRFGCEPSHLDIVYQRPHDKQIFLGSGREDALIEWAESVDDLVWKLRLVAGTDIIGITEFMIYHGYDAVTEDRGRTNTMINFERYAAVVSDATGIGEGIGATELEAISQAIIQLREQDEGSHRSISGGE